MKHFYLALFLAGHALYGQLTLDSLKQIVQPYRLGYSYYFDPFAGKAGYGGPWILTADGGGAAFGDNVVYKFDKAGKEKWKRPIKPQFGEMETQVVASDKKSNVFAFMLSYNPKGYRGGAERIVCFDKTGKLLFDKTLSKYTLMNNPVVSYVKTADDGRIYMRGHVVTDTPEKDKDPVYRYWEGWIDAKGVLTQKAGEVIDWKKQEWQQKFKPE
jgi:hypothetical protein